MIEAIQAGLAACCLFGLALLLLICAAIVIAPFVREPWAKARKIKPLEKAVALVAIAEAFTPRSAERRLSPPKSPLFGVFGLGGIGSFHHLTRVSHSFLRRAR